MPSARELIGKTIVGFEANAIRGNGADGGSTHDPVIYLDDGSFLRFQTQETIDGGGYGVFVVRGKRRSK